MSHRHSGFRQGDRPHLFQIVEGPHVGAEQVDDDVAGVNQDPVAGAFAFDMAIAAGFFVQAFGQMVESPGCWR